MRKAAVNVQMVLSLQSRLQPIRQRIQERLANGKSQKKSLKKKKSSVKFERQKNIERFLQKILIVLHAVLSFLRGTSQYRRLSLLHCSVFWCRNQGAEEVQEHELPYACRRRTTFSVRPMTKIRRRKR